MKNSMNLRIDIPENILKCFGISDDTLFVTSYEKGQIRIETYETGDFANSGGSEAEKNSHYRDGYIDGLFDGFEAGYRKGKK